MISLKIFAGPAPSTRAMFIDPILATFQLPSTLVCALIFEVLVWHGSLYQTPLVREDGRTRTFDHCCVKAGPWPLDDAL